MLAQALGREGADASEARLAVNLCVRTGDGQVEGLDERHRAPAHRRPRGEALARAGCRRREGAGHAEAREQVDEVEGLAHAESAERRVDGFRRGLNLLRRALLHLGGPPGRGRRHHRWGRRGARLGRSRCLSRCRGTAGRSGRRGGRAGAPGLVEARSKALPRTQDEERGCHEAALAGAGDDVGEEAAVASAREHVGGTLGRGPRSLVDFGARGARDGGSQVLGRVTGGDGGAHPVVDFLGLSATQAVALGRQRRAERDDLAGFLLDFTHGGGDEGFTVFGLALGPGPVVVARPMNHEDFDVRWVDGLAGDSDALGVREAPDKRARRANESLGAGGWHRTHRDKGSRPRAPVPWWARHVTPVRAFHEAVQGTPRSATTLRTRGQSRVPTAASRAATSSSSAVTSSAE